MIPHVSKEILEYLEGLYPNKVPAPKDTDREIWMKVGQRTVVDHLKMLQEDQVKRSMTSTE